MNGKATMNNGKIFRSISLTITKLTDFFYIIFGFMVRLYMRDYARPRNVLENASVRHQKMSERFNAIRQDAKKLEKSDQVIASQEQVAREKEQFLRKQQPIDLDDAQTIKKPPELTDEEKASFEKTMELLKKVLTDKKKPDRAGRIAENFIRKAISANNTDFLKEAFLQDKEIGSSLSQSNVDLLASYYIERLMIDEAQKASFLGEGASAVVIDQMIKAWFKQAWFKESLVISTRASDICRDWLVKAFISAAKNKDVSYNHILESARIRGIKSGNSFLSVAEIDDFVDSLAHGLRLNEAKEALSLGASQKARNSLAGIFIDREDLDRALEICRLGIDVYINDILCAKFWKKGWHKKAIEVAKLGITDKAILELRKKCASEGRIEWLEHTVNFTGNELSDDELNQLTTHIVEKK